jgi:hypothetical protein
MLLMIVVLSVCDCVLDLLGQVRRYVYNDVVRLDDLERLIDCSFVQVMRGPSRTSYCFCCRRRLAKGG